MAHRDGGGPCPEQATHLRAHVRPALLDEVHARLLELIVAPREGAPVRRWARQVGSRASAISRVASDVECGRQAAQVALEAQGPPRLERLPQPGGAQRAREARPELDLLPFRQGSQRGGKEPG